MDTLAHEVFTRIYRTNGFNGDESVSGTGSALWATERIRALLPLVLNYCGAKTVLDIPCGDFHWMHEVYLDEGIRYTGADIVDELITCNLSKYGSRWYQFLQLDLLTDTLPQADVVLCRDCLVHFSHADVLRAVANIKQSGSTYLLTTTYTERNVNRSIPTGGWTAYNLKLPPFEFPQPILLINEDCRDCSPGFTDKCLGLWEVARLP
jgi:2-polyprenyl-3-methyl-5-hydroxy-6-metoxy-1,4-benzoquinol methylase